MAEAKPTPTMNESETCPAAALAAEAQRLAHAAYTLDMRHAPSIVGLNATEVDLMEKTTLDYLDSVLKRASYVRAKSAHGALFQLVVAADIVDSSVEGEAVKSLIRLLDSVADYIEELSGVKREEACAERFMPRYLNRHRLIERALEIAEANPAQYRVA